MGLMTAILPGLPKRGRDESRPWLVLHDPSGDFTGRCFRSLDLQSSAWESGTIFWNMHTGQVRVWRQYKFQHISPAGGKE